MIKTVTTTDGINTVAFHEFFRYFWIKNIGDTTVYVSAYSDVSANVDDTAKIDPGEVVRIDNVNDYNVYVSGAGMVEIHAQNEIDCSFKVSKKGGDIPTKTSQLENDSNFVNQTELTSAVNTAVGDVVADIPTKTSQLENDSGFVTAGGITVDLLATTNSLSGSDFIVAPMSEIAKYDAVFVSFEYSTNVLVQTFILVADLIHKFGAAINTTVTAPNTHAISYVKYTRAGSSPANAEFAITNSSTSSNNAFNNLKVYGVKGIGGLT